MPIDKKFLVVCEGPSDFPIIEGIIQHLGTQNGKTFEVQPLAPQIDATTGTANPHGWTQVRRWCQNYKVKTESDLISLPENIRKVAIRKNWEALLALSKADYLLIHIDTDIAAEIDGDFDNTRHIRRDYCENKVNIWLGLSTTRPNCRYLLPTYSIETWILGTYDSTDAPLIFPTDVADYESIVDVEAKLISLGYASKKGVKLKKTYKKYKNNDKYLPRLLSNLDKSKMKCPELLRFVSFVASL